MAKFTLMFALGIGLYPLITRAETLEERLSYLEFKVSQFNCDKKLFFLKQKLKGLADESKLNSPTGRNGAGKFAEKITEVGDLMKAYSEKRQKEDRALRNGFKDLKLKAEKTFIELASTENNTVEIKGLHDKMSEVRADIKRDETKGAILKQEIDTDVKPLLVALQQKVNALKAGVNSTIQEMRKVSAAIPATSDRGDSPQTPCEEGWTLVDRKCYKFKPKAAIDWYSAAAACFMNGGKLAEPETQAELELVLEMVGSNVWLGATDAVDEGNWVWASSHKAAENLLWAENQPNNFANKQHCLEAFRREMNDEQCGARNGYVCEKKAYILE